MWVAVVAHWCRVRHITSDNRTYRIGRLVLAALLLAHKVPRRGAAAWADSERVRRWSCALLLRGLCFTSTAKTCRGA